jgi:hypothetical protein
MTTVYRPGPLWLLVVAMVTGCGGVRAPSSVPLPSVNQRLDDADALTRAGRYAEARAAYTALLVIRSAGDAALLRLGRLALDPLNPDRDVRHAAMYLDRLIADYPQSAVMAEALTWRSLIEAVERLQRDVRRHQHELERLGRDLRREQQDTAKLREERERLRQIDMEFERPRQLQSPSTSGPSSMRLPE